MDLDPSAQNDMPFNFGVSYSSLQKPKCTFYIWQIIDIMRKASRKVINVIRLCTEPTTILPSLLNILNQVNKVLILKGAPDVGPHIFNHANAIQKLIRRLVKLIQKWKLTHCIRVLCKGVDGCWLYTVAGNCDEED